MGEPDTLTREYMQIPEHFADLFNYYLCDGVQKIKPEHLKECDPIMILDEIDPETKKHISVNLLRDILKQCVIYQDENRTYVALGIENQTHIDYLMPARIMLYDALFYYRQIRNIKDELENKGDIASLPGSAPKGTKLHPVFTLVCYWGTKPWDGPRSLREILHAPPSNIDSNISDYKIHIFDPNQLDECNLAKFKTKLRLVWKCYLYSQNKNGMKKMVKEDTSYQSLDGLTVMLLDRMLRLKLKTENIKKEETVNMCQAWDEILADEREEGRNEIRQELALVNAKFEAVQAENDFLKEKAASLQAVQAENDYLKEKTASLQAVQAENATMKEEFETMRTKYEALLKRLDKIEE